MRISDCSSYHRGLVTLCVVLFAFASLPLFTGARAATPSIRIVNNSNRTIRNVYLSHVNADDWGANQLGDAPISPGQSFTITGFTWDQQQLKVIGEDQDGCFLSSVVAYDDNVTWTITNDTPAECNGSSN